jgi:hypothetical protein
LPFPVIVVFVVSFYVVILTLIVVEWERIPVLLFAVAFSISCAAA